MVLRSAETHCKFGDFLPSFPFSSPFVKGVFDRERALVSGGDGIASMLRAIGGDNGLCDRVYGRVNVSKERICFAPHHSQ